MQFETDEKTVWCLLRCKQNTWRTTMLSLEQLGLRVHCPLIHERRRRKDTQNSFRLVCYPAFPGYIFVCLNAERFSVTPLYSIPGILGLVKWGKRIARIDSATMSALIMAGTRVLEATTSEFQCIGIPDKLTATIKRIYEQTDPDERVNFLLDLVSRERIALIKKEENLSY
ncbi:hypothetical protein J0B02_00985 [Enterobacteriaceae bacterium YMB-R22]|jgi:transcription antitermination factor NusG|uniref:transcription termination/antitermination NusG family protein n=1 Tax=Tenebrionicola larvae TaxID=2815733 RepID=UPI002011BE06|nr:transcription termination/antitermination NusG family protein [Tenebrionicola larvae]MBV4411432.1 hypothetical protein [Tenebrionicola larvae]